MTGAHRALAALLLLCSAGDAAAQESAGYPRDVENYINDFAKVLPAAHAAQLREALRRLEHQTGIELTVVTVGSIHDYGTGDPSIESFATKLFNRWGVGDRSHNDGVMILVATRDRRCRIELGSGYGRRYDEMMQWIIDTKMTPHFKKGDLAQGIHHGVYGVIGALTKKTTWLNFYKWHLALGGLIVICIIAGVSCIRSGRRGWGWTFFGIAFALLFFLLRMMSKGKSSSGHGSSGTFGGGSSFGGGASGSW